MAGSDTSSRKSSRNPGADGGLSFLTEAPVEPSACEPGSADDNSKDGETGIKKGLIEEAELRAQQQALARVTMLDLCDELTSMARSQREAEARLAEEHKLIERLQKELARLTNEVVQAKIKEEEAKERYWTEKFAKSLTSERLVSNMMLWSRSALPIETLMPPDDFEDAVELREEMPDNDRSSDVNAPASGGDQTMPDMASASAPSALAPEGGQQEGVEAAAAVEDGPRREAFDDAKAAPAVALSSPGSTQASWYSRLNTPKTQSMLDAYTRKVDPALWRNDVADKRLLKKDGERSRGDGLTLLLLLQSWSRAVAKLKQERAEEEAEEARRRAQEAELQKLRVSHEKEQLAAKAKVATLERENKAQREEIERLKNRTPPQPAVVEKEVVRDDGQIDALKAQLADALQQLEASKEWERKCKEAEELAAQRGAQVESLTDSVRKLELDLLRQREAFDEERQRMQAELRDVAAELQRQIVLATHLKESLLASKRGGNTVSAEKFAQLLHEMEEMRDRLTMLSTMYSREKEAAEHFRRRLEQNKRRLELERQFLPLLHKVRGPVGPKCPLFQKNLSDLANVAMVPDEMGPGASVMGSPGDRLRMATSQSTGALEAIAKRPDIKGGQRLRG